jgi:type II secretion system protein G
MENSMKKLHRWGHAGFTLMEIMLVVVIIGILAAAVLPKLTKQLPFVQNKTAKNDLATIENVLDTYYIQNGDYPTTDQGLKALVEKPTTPLLQKIGMGLMSKKFQQTRGITHININVPVNITLMSMTFGQPAKAGKMAHRII